jgi:hypothetical protein
MHINEKEVIAAIATIKRIKQENCEPCQIFLIIDSVVARARLMGKIDPENELESVVFLFLEEMRDDWMEYILVKSELNVADEPSRNKEINEEREAASLKVWQTMRDKKRWFE